MAAIASKVALTFGLVTINVAVHNALDKPKSGNKLVCTGTGKEHPLSLIRQVHTCAECGEVPYTALKRARPVADGLVLLEDEEIAEARTDSLATKTATALSPHPSEQVESTTVPGSAMYYLMPNPGFESAYAIVATLVAAHPELAFMSLWTPRTRTGQFLLRSVDGVLVWQERVRQENVRSRPEVSADAPAPMVAMAEQVLSLPGVVSDYDPTTYADTFEQKIAAVAAAKAPVSVAAPSPDGQAPPVVASDAMSALQAMLDAAKPAPKAKAKSKRKAS